MAEKRTDTNDHQISKDQAFELPATGSIAEMNFKDNFEITDKTDIQRLNLERFMEEDVVVVVHEPHDPDAPLLLTTCINGRSQVFFKGMEQTVKRKFVECLARAKKTHIKTPEILDPDGVRTTRITKKAMLEHPFYVVHDANPIGHKWLTDILAEA